jgi:hypothetical protein
VPTIYVARSMSLQKWGAEVGQTKHLFKVGVAEGRADAAIAALNAEAHAGQTDWKLLKAQSVDEADEAAVHAKLGAKLREVDPGLYPKLRGAHGIYKIRPEFVATHSMVQHALTTGDREPSLEKVKPADVANYLLHHATQGS